MPVRLNITLDDELYRRLKKELPPKGISAFIGEAVRARLRPSREQLDAAYKSATHERWRSSIARDWARTDGEGWPE